MPISTEVVTVGDEATALNAVAVYGQTLFLKNTSANDADLGAADVVATEGFSLGNGESVTLQLAPGDVVYAINTVAESAAVINVFRT